MDQTINETMEYAKYRRSIENTCKAWEKQQDKKFSTSGRIIGKYGYIFYKENGKLHQLANTNFANYVIAKIEAQNLRDRDFSSETKSTSAVNVASNFANEM